MRHRILPCSTTFCLTLLVTLILLVNQQPEPSLLYRGLAATPNDPALVAAGQSYAPQLLNLFTAWDYPVVTTDVVIAILDTGIAHHHPEFAGRILPGFDFINDDHDPEDDLGHGAHVAGIAAAAVDNGQGVAGVCGFCKILPVKIVTAQESYSPAGIELGLKYAADNGADIVILSLGHARGSSQIVAGIEYARDRGLFIVAAAGNDHSSIPVYPAAYAGVFAVAATTQGDQAANYSNYGDYIDVAAPGDAIYSTDIDLSNANGGYAYRSGTNMAAPFVAGLAALLVAQDPTRTPDDLARLITTTAFDLGEPGWDPVFGHGRIDPVAALAAEAVNPPATALLHGAVWYDDNRNTVRELEEESGLPGVQIVVRDQQQRIVGLTITRGNGEWQWSALAPADYTVNPYLPHAIPATGASSLTVAVGPATPIEPLNFGVMRLPTDDDFQSFGATRFRQQVNLSWLVTPAVTTVHIQRATSAGGAYALIGSLPISGASASSLPVDFIDALPADLQNTGLYYRIQLAPGDLLIGPFFVDAQSVEHRLFLPLVDG